MTSDRNRLKDPGVLVHVGCAGWSVPGAMHDRFPAAGSHLERYAAVLPAVEINTSFYRPHRAATYARWRDSVPEAFRFSAKLPKAITHEARLHGVEEALEKFIGEVSHLERKLGCLLVQLPPSLRFDATTALRFFVHLRALTQVPVVCEPRHLTWFTPAAAGMLAGMGVGYVDADPSIAPVPEEAEGAGVLYLRMHGSPVIYHSKYPEEAIAAMQARIESSIDAGRHAWCIFDNTASGEAVPDALSLLARLHALQAAA
ncbi:DUF72 domain-containing protein [Noviherbaspirillum denitrificans]|uniref:DUF72 domain-containing protein n=1 Tax=Noviherbaspirillum denitrificans TaxID=1968433 RepID=A0A254TE40_9BURK|nr:DUF72 domain-containing protein [Noviherbaspirillum denitrificans]OWW20916.1 hypothetical protein AYR66_17020 [Noviherbaspirillum denitrificans]